MRLLLLALLPLSVQADNLHIHLGSDHSADGNYEEKNYGIGYYHDFTSRWHGSTLLLRNSHGDPALFTCGTYGAGLSMGVCLVAGYENTIDRARELLPAPIITWRVLDTRVSPRINLIPAYEQQIVSFGIDIRYE